MKFKLMNIKYEEIIEIKINFKMWKKYLYLLINFKKSGNKKESTEDFLKECFQIKKWLTDNK